MNLTKTQMAVDFAPYTVFIWQLLVNSFDAVVVIAGFVLIVFKIVLAKQEYQKNKIELERAGKK